MGAPPVTPYSLILRANQLCFQVGDARNFCVTLPGGAEICAITSLETGDVAQIVRGMIQQVNTALAPLAPFFTILDLAVAIVECVKAVPDALASFPPQPQKIFECIPGLLEALEKLLALAPPLSIPKLVKGICLVLAETLRGISTELRAMIRQNARLLAAATEAAKPGNVALVSVLDCARANFDAELANLNASMAPLNRLVGYVNLLLELAQVPQVIPDFDELGADAEQALEIVDPVIGVLEAIADAIPVP